VGAAEQLTEPWTYHGEGPVWDPGPGLLRWVDLYAGDVLSLAPRTEHVQRAHVGTVAAALRPRVGGGLVVAVERGFCLLGADEAEPHPLGEVWTDPTVRMNDGGCDLQGRFYCGSMAYDAAPGRGALYCLEPDGAVRRVLDDVTISNGIAWSRDGTQVYYVDSPTRRVDVFDFDPDSGAFTDRRAAVEVDPDDGMPDGITLDSEGGVWVALWGGGAVHRYTAEGRLDEVVDVGPRQVSACTFGGDRLDELFITTSREGLPPDEQPTAGALYWYRPGVSGLPVMPYAG
jgi:sugar lactone lactonase YvrE